jgi:hypothetical protein
MFTVSAFVFGFVLTSNQIPHYHNSVGLSFPADHQATRTAYPFCEPTEGLNTVFRPLNMNIHKGKGSQERHAD